MDLFQPLNCPINNLSSQRAKAVVRNFMVSTNNLWLMGRYFKMGGYCYLNGEEVIGKINVDIIENKLKSI